MSPNWLTELAPAHAPPAPRWWPPAPGWWIVAALALLLLAGFLWWRRDPHRSSRRAALRELKRIREEGADPRASARAIESVLRRYAMAVFGRERVARLTGRSWLEFVAAEGGAALPSEVGRSLLAAAFGSAARDDRELWLAGADAFVRRAKPGGR